MRLTKLKNYKKNNSANFFSRNGYLVVKVFNKNEIELLKNKIKKKAEKFLKNKKWNLADYHKHVNLKNNYKITNNRKRYINVTNGIINKIKNNKKIKTILIKTWNHSSFIIPDQKYLMGKSKTTSLKKIKKKEVQFRIVIPQKKNNFIEAAPPPHVDLNAAKITKKIINGKKYMDTSSIQLTLWTPLIGFSKNYTLRVAPGSHTKNHPINRISKENKSYVSPVFEKKYYQNYKFKRFDLKKGEAILFDGNLIHGGTKNLGSKSRVNLEFRIYNSENVNLSK